jgi:hypothetical protein
MGNQIPLYGDTGRRLTNRTSKRQRERHEANRERRSYVVKGYRLETRSVGVGSSRRSGPYLVVMLGWTGEKAPSWRWRWTEVEDRTRV